METLFTPAVTERVRRNPEWEPCTNPARTRYPSDVSDQQWAGIAPLVSHAAPVGRPRQYALRDVVDALNYRWQTGCSWRMLPHDFPPWPTVYGYFRGWQRRGLLRPIRETLLRPRQPESSSGGGVPSLSNAAPSGT